MFSSSQALSYTFGGEVSSPPLQLYIESGHAATYVIPIMRNNVITTGVKRIDIGGKLLTKLLTQSISTRQVKLQEYFLTAQSIKEDMCYVSKDFKAELKDNSIAPEYYVLPDPDIKRKGYKCDKPDESGFLQYICLGKERFIIPEHIFSPSLSNSSQPGLLAGILASLKSVHEDFYGPLLKNIVIHGGNTLFPGFKERFDREIRENSDSFVVPHSQHIRDRDGPYRALNEITMSDWFENTCYCRGLYNEIGYAQMSSLF